MRSTAGILSAFGTHAFLDRLSEQHRMRLVKEVRPFAKAAGEFLAKEGQPANALYLIQSGHVEIASHDSGGECAPLAEVGPGEVIGWSWILPPYRWHFDCRAKDDVKGLMLHGDWLREQCELDHELGYNLLKHLLAVLAERLAATRQAETSRQSTTVTAR